MKTKNKVLLILTCMCLIVATTVMATMAYLADEDTVVNTFTVGNVDLKLDEAAVNLDGTEIAGADRVQGNKYHLLPGKTYTKDPTVTVLKNSEECYVRMLVTLNCKSKLDAMLDPGVDLKTIFNGYDQTTWAYKTEKIDTSADTVTYEFRYAGTGTTPDPTPGTFGGAADDIQLPALFTSFTVPTSLDGEDLAKLQDNPETTEVEPSFTITVVAHAIQAEGFADADAAWTAFDAQP